jgi:cyclic pyranopterin phosphate synthase
MASETNRPTHVDADGAVHMVGVGEKAVSARRAVARARVRMSPETAAAARSGDGPKGDVGATVRLAGIMGAKRTPEVIPLCHHVALTGVTVALSWVEDGAEIVVTAEALDRTGVEMEAMTGASVAALALYDMVKGLERGVAVTEVALLEKSGGRTGAWRREE